MAAHEIYDETTDQETQNSIISRIIRGLANATSANESNRAMIQSVPGVFKTINSCVYGKDDDELSQMACRLIRLLSSSVDYRKQASKYCGELVAKVKGSALLSFFVKFGNVIRVVKLSVKFIRVTGNWPNVV